jgi:hypothetical protein
MGDIRLFRRLAFKIGGPPDNNEKAMERIAASIDADTGYSYTCVVSAP